MIFLWHEICIYKAEQADNLIRGDSHEDGYGDHQTIQTR